MVKSAIVVTSLITSIFYLLFGVGIRNFFITLISIFLFIMLLGAGLFFYFSKIVYGFSFFNNILIIIPIVLYFSFLSVMCSGCRNSYFFDVAMRESEKDLEDIIDFYDYIEVQPPSRFEYQKNNLDNWYYCITDTIKRIIRVAKKHNIPVVATGDCHQINKEDTIFRDILISYQTKSSAYRHYLKDPKRGTPTPDEYFMTTREMLDEFSFLGEQLAYEIVVLNTNLIADNCEFVKSFSNKALPPKDDFMKDKGIPSAEAYVKETVYNKAHELYGEMLPGIVMDRIEHELKPIMDNKFSTIYLISQLLVNKSRSDGYVVGSRGSVGSSFIANLMDITEVNSLPPHYRCPKCHFTAFKYKNY